MPKIRSDDDASIHIFRTGGQWRELRIEWAEGVDDGAGNRVLLGETAAIPADQLPAALLADLDTLLTRVLGERDKVRPLR